MLSVVTLAAMLNGVGPYENISPRTSAPQQKSLPTLRATARLVYVDVVVHDKSGQPVHGLKAEDFAVLESGRSQVFREFQEHSAPTAEELARMPLIPKLAEGTFSNFAAAAAPKADGPLNILLLDRLNTATSDQKQMQKQINEYLLHAPAGQRMAIFGLADHLILLEGFTTDMGAIQAAVNSRKGMQGTSLLSPPLEMLFMTNGNAPGNPDDTSDVSRGPTASMNTSDMSVNHNREKLAADQVETRALNTLQAMDELAAYLMTLPGRKNLIWFSGSFPVGVQPTMSGELPGLGAPGLAGPRPPGMADNPFEPVKSMEPEFEHTSSMLSRAQVAVYPIDVKGLMNASIFNADDNGCNNGMCFRNTQKQADTDFGEHNYGEHSTMNQLADETGGKAAINTNDFSAAMRNALDDGANYYTIAYAPSNPRWDGKFRQIEVKLKEKGYKLSYRKGYFAQEVQEPTGSKPMQIALLHGGPEPTQILFTVHVQPATALPEAQVAANNKPGNDVKGPWRRYEVEFSVDARSVAFAQGADGHRHVTLEFMAYVYGAEGAPVNTIGRTIQADVPAEAYAQFAKSGVPYKLEVSVPARGTYSLRLAVHDVGDDHVGAVEVPVSAVSGLAPVEAAVAH